MSGRNHVIQDDQQYETDSTGAVRHQRILVEEHWETIGGDGKPYVLEATREDAIYAHLRSNAGLSDARREIHELGGQSEVVGEPLTGVRHVVRYETSSAWEVISDVEPLDELAEIANTQPCDHPPDRAMNVGAYGKSKMMCGRCCTYLADLT